MFAGSDPSCATFVGEEEKRERERERERAVALNGSRGGKSQGRVK
jgi:hypothetical protein